MSERPELVELDIFVDREKFVKETAVQKLRSMDASCRPLWGMMSAQHMVEHLIYITENIIGEREIQLLTPEEKLPKYRAFLMGSFGFMRNFKFPMLPQDALVPLRFETFGASLTEFEKITDRLFDLLDDPGFKTALHPMYGHLNREETIMFQFKHLNHHLMQFGLLGG